MLDANTHSLKLAKLAESVKAEHQYLSRKSFYRPIFPSQFSNLLLPLALEASGKSKLEPEEILPVFFEEEACEWLMKLPNLYWFWQVLDKTYEWRLDLDMDRSNKLVVFRAMGVVRQSVKWSWVGCNLPPEQLSCGQLVTRTAWGVFLAGEKDQIVRNVIFTLDYCPDYNE